ncbi:MAG TPA: 16S rRNA (adenine(1518)-N(6)/adenine(1519)-N(6))-dimethyltransferase RsmA [Bryobacteraceae bacterium]|nr:16S rRNA (adenine(1518)-N(6)/adenine(1519)-N(6))-dimethyltransferase RsmA [Bryobacteraceae bacterium]
MARQKLGQHFLASSGILEKIALAACGSRAELAVEIGPGRGALTTHLLAHADRVIAIEIDSALIQVLREKWPSEPRLELRQADALKVDFSGFGAGVLAGNLPYYAASAIISGYLRNPGELRQGTFLIQREVAERIGAVPRTREYGYLSVECQCLARVEFLFSVPPGAFHPPPKVDSATIRVTPVARAADLDYIKFLAFVSACFRQKRKTLRNNLSRSYRPEILSRSSRMSRRAEELTVEEFIELFRLLDA